MHLTRTRTRTLGAHTAGADLDAPDIRRALHLYRAACALLAALLGLGWLLL